MDVVIASDNSGKIRELDQLLAPMGWRIQSQQEQGVRPVAETRDTFVENALLKAHNAAHESGHAALADDSGLVVAALGGRPGIYSSRFAGPQADDTTNLHKLLEELAGIPAEQREAFYYCSLVLLRYPGDPCPLIAEGRWGGRIAFAPVGSGGFGYDPIFLVPGHGCTAAQLTPSTKAILSHRAQALQRLRALLERPAG